MIESFCTRESPLALLRCFTCGRQPEGPYAEKEGMVYAMITGIDKLGHVCIIAGTTYIARRFRGSGVTVKKHQEELDYRS